MISHPTDPELLQAAQNLLGQHIVMPGLRARIVETEAYGPADPGCHAYRGITPRTTVMFDRPGLAYTYFTYGNHWMFCVTALEPGTAGAILIRAAVPLEGIETMRERRPKAKRDQDLLNGPGKLCAALQINQSHYALDLTTPNGTLWLEPGDPPQEIRTGTRIGLAEGKGDLHPWRFWAAEDEPYVSRPLTNLILPARRGVGETPVEPVGLW
jgi:DNA-3-methyladenine glycosylase